MRHGGRAVRQRQNAGGEAFAIDDRVRQIDQIVGAETTDVAAEVAHRKQLERCIVPEEVDGLPGVGTSDQSQVAAGAEVQLSNAADRLIEDERRVRRSHRAVIGKQGANVGNKVEFARGDVHAAAIGRRNVDNVGDPCPAARERSGVGQLRSYRGVDVGIALARSRPAH